MKTNKLDEIFADLKDILGDERIGEDRFFERVTLMDTWSEGKENQILYRYCRHDKEGDRTWNQRSARFHALLTAPECFGACMMCLRSHPTVCR